MFKIGRKYRVKTLKEILEITIPSVCHSGALRHKDYPEKGACFNIPRMNGICGMTFVCTNLRESNISDGFKKTDALNWTIEWWMVDDVSKRAKLLESLISGNL